MEAKRAWRMASMKAALSLVKGDLPVEDLSGFHPLLLHGGQAPSEDRLADEGQRHALVQGRDAGPLAGALLACGVPDVLHQGRAVLVLEAQDVPGDLDQVGVQLRLVPLGKDLMHLLVGEAQQVPHELVGFADELHVAVLDAVVDHLHEVARAVLPVAAGGAVLHLGADGLEDGLHIGPGRGGAAGHHGGALQSALFAAGHAGADVELALRFHVLRPPDGVGEVAVAAVDQDVPVLEEGQQLLDHAVHGAAGLHHHEDLAGLGEVRHQLLKAVAADDVLAGGPAVHEGVHLGGGAVEDGHGEALGLHVHDQVLAHDGEADEADVCFLHK